MKYSLEIIINLPREKVIAKMANPINFKHWQKGFLPYKHLSGELGEEGARAKLKYNIKNRELTLIETIEKSNLPKKLFTSYEANGVHNTQRNYFEEVTQNTTKWISDNHFEFSGFMKIIALLMPGSFKEQSNKFMKDFKAFAEHGTSVLNEQNGKTN